jgi:hypothetical protein
MQFRQLGHSQKKPLDYVVCRLQYSRILTRPPKGQDYAQTVMIDMPLEWNQIIKPSEIGSEQELLERVFQYEKELTSISESKADLQEMRSLRRELEGRRRRKGHATESALDPSLGIEEDQAELVDRIAAAVTQRMTISSLNLSPQALAVGRDQVTRPTIERVILPRESDLE